MQGTGSRGQLGGRGLRFGYGRPLVQNPAFIQMSRMRVSEAHFLGLGNAMADTLLYAPGWYDYGGSETGSIESASQSGSPLGQGPHGSSGVRVSCSSGYVKGLVVPIPYADSLGGKRVRLRVIYKPVAGTHVGVYAALSGRLYRQTWADPLHLGMSGAKAQAFAADTSGIGHLVSMYAKDGAWTSKNPFSIGAEGIVLDPASLGRLTTFNRLYDSWRTDDGTSQSEITVDVPATGANHHDEDHFVWFLDYDVEGASSRVYPLHTEAGTVGVLSEVDVVVQLPESDDPDFPRQSALTANTNVTWLVLLPLDQDQAVSGDNSVDFYYCQLEVLDDSPTSGLLAAGLEGVLGGGLHAGWWANFCMAYPVYTPGAIFLPGEAFHYNHVSGPVPLNGVVHLVPSSTELAAWAPVPPGAVAHSAAFYMGALGGSNTQVRFQQAHAGHLFDYGPTILRNLLKAFSAGLANTEVVHPCKRNRFGSLTTGSAGESLLNAYPLGQDGVVLHVNPSDGTFYGARLDLLVDPRLALAGHGLVA